MREQSPVKPRTESRARGLAPPKTVGTLVAPEKRAQNLWITRSAGCCGGLLSRPRSGLGRLYLGRGRRDSTRGCADPRIRASAHPRVEGVSGRQTISGRASLVLRLHFRGYRLRLRCVVRHRGQGGDTSPHGEGLIRVPEAGFDDVDGGVLPGVAEERTALIAVGASKVGLCEDHGVRADDAGETQVGLHVRVDDESRGVVVVCMSPLYAREASSRCSNSHAATSSRHCSRASRQ